MTKTIQNKKISVYVDPVLYTNLVKKQLEISLERVQSGGKKISLNKLVLNCISNYFEGEKK